MIDLLHDLQQALDNATRDFAAKDLARSVERLIERYHEPAGVPRAPILGSDLDIAAYAAYRMPATCAATRAAMRFCADLAPAFAPRTLLDIGGGTGAATWAAAGVWESLKKITVVEQLPRAIALGRRLAASATHPVIRTATWQEADVATAVRLPASDLATASYLLGELPADARKQLVEAMAGCARAIVIVEPGTPDGYQRVLAARDLLIARGLMVVAPCPHQRACPIPHDRDWCHFSVRLNRSAIQRRIKAATLGFEDEKFSYVAATIEPAQSAPNRVIRHPQKRTGQVRLRLCSGQGALTDVVVSRREREIYRAARKVSWGETWPPLDSTGR